MGRSNKPTGTAAASTNAADKPSTEAPATEKSATEKSATEKSATEKLATEKSATEKLATEKSATDKSSASDPPPSRGFGAFIRWASNNTQFFSSVVIGGAGLIATSLYQCNAAKLAQRQAESQQQIAAEAALNSWRIERAKILSQNLQTLTARGGDNAEQRYGVLLSLSRGNILDPDLAVTYALELGKDSPEYMASVLSNIERKDLHHYRRLASAYLPTCTQRYGVSVSGLAICKDDRLAERSRAIAEVIADDAEPQLGEGRAGGPLLLLQDSREVNASLLRLVGLFSPFVEDLYERRQWATLQRLFSDSSGAALVGSLALLMQSSDLAASSDLEVARQLFDERERWLEGYVLSASCDAECRGRVLNIVLSNLGRGQGHFRQLLRTVLDRPRGESSVFVHRLNGRLTYCQLDPDEQPSLRDHIIVPVLQSWVTRALATASSAPQPPAGPTPAAKAPTAAATPTAALPNGGATTTATAGTANTTKVVPGKGAPPAPPPVAPLASLMEPAQVQIDELVGLLALLPQPTEPNEAWKKLLAELNIATKGRQPALYHERWLEEQRRRKLAAQPLMGPPAPTKGPVVSNARKSKNFCAVMGQFEDASEEEE